MANRDDFNKPTVDSLAKRVGFLCSNPDCGKSTVGPNSDPEKATIMGVASHITAAAEKGPRYDKTLKIEERKHINNGIWLCVNCSVIIDKDAAAYPVTLLQKWKRNAEKKALERIKGINSLELKDRPKIEVDLLYKSSIRTPRGYAEENFKDGKRVIKVWEDNIQFWDLSWHYQLVIMNNSSFPAYNISIDYSGIPINCRIKGLDKKNNIPPFLDIDLDFDTEAFFKGTYKEADKHIKSYIPNYLNNSELILTYEDEGRNSHKTIVKIIDNEIVNEFK